MLFLRQILLNLLHVFVALGRWRENARDLQRFEFGIGSHPRSLNFGKFLIVLDGVVDRAGGKNCVEFPVGGRGVMLEKDRLNDLLLLQRLGASAAADRGRRR